MLIKHPTLYHIDENDNVRVWWMETKGSSYRTVSGIEDGKLVTSGWTIATPKNVGKANETTGEEQAELEVESKYLKKAEKKYSYEKTKAAKSHIIQPMLAIKWADIKKKDEVVKGCWVQPKLDGIRAIVNKDGIWSRNGKPIVSSPHVLTALENFFNYFPNSILDGELYNHNFRDDFNEISSLVGQKKPTPEDLANSKEHVQYHVYDIITNLNFADRITILENLFKNAVIKKNPVRLVDTEYCANIEHVDAFYAKYLEVGYEGQMIRLNKPYEHKRSKSLIKRKEFFDAEYRILSISEGKGNWAGYAKSVECIDDQGRKFSAGIKGSQEFTKKLLSMNPKTCTVRSPNMTPDGIPRFGVAVAFYENEREL